MIYKLYIDYDEEITTAIDRLRQIDGRDVAVIVPQRALLLQSIVNLRLLGREAERMQKNIVLVTPDRDGQIFAERAGLNVEASVDVFDDDMIRDAGIPAEKDTLTYLDDTAEDATPVPDQMQPRRRADDIGSEGYATGGGTASAERVASRRTMTMPDGAPIAPAQSAVPRRRSISGDSLRAPQRSVRRRTQTVAEAPGRLARIGAGIKKIVPKRSVPLSSSHAHGRELGSSFLTLGRLMSLVGLLIIIFVIFGMVFPRTVLTAHRAQINIEENFRMTADASVTGVDADKSTIPGRVIEKEVTFDYKTEATGRGEVAPQRAQGTITIVSTLTQTQPLVERTRFLAENGTLFRLTKNVVVPAATGDKPGSIDVFVVADQPGESGNTAPTTFSIPGFAGSAKHTQITAKSERELAGGSAGGTDAVIVTEDDLRRAQAEAEKGIVDFAVEEIKAVLREGEAVLPEALVVTTSSSAPAVVAGTATPELTHVVKAQVQAMVFTRGDVEGIVRDTVIKKDERLAQNRDDIAVEYREITPDFETKTMVMAVRGAGQVTPDVDGERLREDAVGKRHGELEEVLSRSYPQIERIELNVWPMWPAFVSERISRVKGMTKVVVE